MPTETKSALFSRRVWGTILTAYAALLAILSWITPETVGTLLAPIFALAEAVLGSPVPVELQDRARNGLLALSGIVGVVALIRSKIAPDGKKLTLLPLLALAFLLPLGCVAGLPVMPGFGTGGASAEQPDPAAVAQALAELGTQAIVFRACPEELRTVEATPDGRVRLGCAGAGIGSFACEPPQVFGGLRIFVDPADGQKRAEPICVDPAELAPPA